jgi:hypothetical protein
MIPQYLISLISTESTVVACTESQLLLKFDASAYLPKAIAQPAPN